MIHTNKNLFSYFAVLHASGGHVKQNHLENSLKAGSMLYTVHIFKMLNNSTGNPSQGGNQEGKQIRFKHIHFSTVYNSKNRNGTDVQTKRTN